MCFSLPGLALSNSFDQFIGIYEVQDQICLENGESITKDCDIKEVRIEYMNGELYINESDEKTSTDYKIYIEDTDISYSHGQYVFKLATIPDRNTCDFACASWILNQEERLLSSIDNRLYSHIFKQSRTINIEENNKIIYSFSQYESRDGTGRAPVELKHNYTLKVK